MSLKRTPFYAAHVALGAQMIDFGGWEMPVRYEGLIPEHRATRRAGGLFDVSHMGEIRVAGPKALASVNRLTLNDVTEIPLGGSQYSAIPNTRGGLVDDIFVYRLGDDELFICVNASNQDKDFAWFVQNNPFPGEAVYTNESALWAQVAVQGRIAGELAQSLSGAALSGLGRGDITPGDFAGVGGCLLARTGYTGEDGFEVFIPAAEAAPVFQRVLDAGADRGLVPAGLGARDTLRLEARNVLYGHEIDEDSSPLEAGLGWITRLDKLGGFLGLDAVAAVRREGLRRRLVGLVVEKRIPRQGHPILSPAGEVIGAVTSGTRCPTDGRNIALGYVAARDGFARPGSRLQVDVRGRLAPAVVVKGPFFKRDY